MFLEKEGLRGRARALIPADPKIYAHLPYVIELDDEVVRTRDNGLMISLEVTGIDGITSGSSAVTALRAGFAHLLDTLDERFSFYLHRMMRPAQAQLKPIHGQSFAADIDRAWTAELQHRNLQESVLILTVVRRQVAPLAVPLFGKAAAKVWGEDTDRRLEELREVVSILETGLGVKSHRLKISNGSLIGFYASLLTGELRAKSRSPFGIIAEDASDAAIHFGKGQFTVEAGADTPRIGAVLYVKSYATSTWPGMLDALGASRDTIITHSYTPIERGSITDPDTFFDDILPDVADLTGGLIAAKDGSYSLMTTSGKVGDKPAAQYVSEFFASAGLDVATVDTLANSEDEGAARIGTQANTAAFLSAAAETSSIKASESLERVHELVQEIPDTEGLKEAIDLNTRVTAELSIALANIWNMESAQLMGMGEAGVMDAATAAEEQKFIKVLGGE